MKIAIAFLLVTGALPPLSVAPAKAADSVSTFESLKTWFQHWKDGLASSAVEGQYQQKSLTAVAAVRGGNQERDYENPDKPYIKGRLEDMHARQLKKERAELGQAVELILSGKTDEGAKKLDDFETKHPKSTLLADVQLAREKLKELKTASSK